MKAFSVLVLVLVLLTILGGRSWAAETKMHTFREADLWHLAEQAQAEEEQNQDLMPAGPLDRYLEGVLKRLWDQTQTSLPPMTVRVIQDSNLKAYTYPNGICYISSGMLGRIQSEDQLAMILAHEMIHYMRRHTLKAQGRFAMPFVDAGQGPSSQRRSAVRGHPDSLRAFIQTAERQADREGLALMRRAGYCPQQVLALLANLEATTMPPEDRFARPPAVSRRMRQFRALLEDKPSSDGCPDFDRARQAYRKRIAPALIADARAALQRGQWDQAQASVSQYLSVRPQDPQAHFILGQIQSHQSSADSLQQAMAAYQEAIRLDPSYSAAYGALGVIHFKAGRKTMARRYFETFLTLAPQDSESAYIREYLQLCHE